MNLIRLAAQIFLIYLLYKLIVNIVIPVYRSTRQIKTQFREMQDQMNKAAHHHHNTAGSAQSSPVTEEKFDKEDYIEFEEIK